MKGEGIRRELEGIRDLAGRHSFRAGLHQQSEHVETVVLGERGKSYDSIRFFHYFNEYRTLDGLSRVISMNIEIANQHHVAS